MFGSIKPGANAYAKVDIDTGALAASPHKLTTMLFDAALLALVMAQHHMKANEIEKKGKAISRAIMMIESGLRASLDKKAGGAIADNLDALYEYMGQQLLTANIKNQPELLVEVHALLTDLRSTWLEIDPAASATAAQPAAQVSAPAAPAAPKTNAYGALAPRASGFVYA
jgi:flagellar protein FliS